MNRVFRLIEGFESPLLASVHWVASQSDSPPTLAAVVARIHAWNDRKRRLMKADHIQLAWERLAAETWLAGA